MDTVLVGGIGVLVLMFIVWKIHNWLENAELSPTLKRLASYALMLLIIVAVGFVINWHRNSWMASL